ncbi:MAG TPA: D-aminoacyl-tRNA deacylase, partial [Acidothermaceae bacterium]|nr:D-aminoacyl-tRNA deacylase [Acidothermaceae bacterium]
QTVGAIDRPGLVVLVGITHTDTITEARWMASKLHTLRILNDEKSCADVDAPLLVISQFTLYADTRKGRRPSWNAAAPADAAEPLVAAVVDALRELGAEVATGRFGADMLLHLVNDGPLTLVVDS